jgi:hypothetical protein
VGTACRLGIWVNDIQVRAMSEQFLGSLPSNQSGGDAVLIDLRGLEAARRSVAQDSAGDKKPLTQAEREQLARDIADIENAAAALRKAPPALKSWTKPPPSPMLSKARPLWLLIGALWLSTALVTAGAVVAIHSFVG